jgi:heme exporter protein D
VSAQGMTLIEWEPEFLESIGEWYVWVAVAISAVVALISGFMAVRERR